MEGNISSKNLSIGVVVLVLVALGYFLVLPRLAVAPVSSVATTTPSTASTTTTDLGNGITATGPAGAKIELVPITPSHPSLAGAIKISQDIAPDTAAILRAKEEAAISQLKQSPNRIDLWLQLGLYRKMAEDYQGAADAWEYAGATGPTSLNYVAYGDLGDLYMNFLKDYPKAEASYKKAIAIQPTVIEYYRSLATLYTSFYKTGTTAAIDIINQGLVANPGNPDLLTLKAQYQPHAQ